MPAESVVRSLDQLPVKAPFTDPGLIASHKQYSPPVRIKGKGDSPHAIICGKAKLLHVGVARSVQCIHPRAAQSWAERLKETRLCEKLVLHYDRQ